MTGSVCPLSVAHLTGGDVPQFDRVVVAGRGEGASVRRELDGPDHARVAVDGASIWPELRVPQHDRAVITA